MKSLIYCLDVDFDQQVGHIRRILSLIIHHLQLDNKIGLLRFDLLESILLDRWLNNRRVLNTVYVAINGTLHVHIKFILEEGLALYVDRLAPIIEWLVKLIYHDDIQNAHLKYLLILHDQIVELVKWSALESVVYVVIAVAML